MSSLMLQNKHLVAKRAQCRGCTALHGVFETFPYRSTTESNDRPVMKPEDEPFIQSTVNPRDIAF